MIAAINGAAVGIGATMTLAADFRMASEKARIGFVFGRLGIVPEACSSWFLPRLVGMQQALEWCYTADIFDAAEGLRGGLLRSVHAPETLLADARAFALRLITKRSPVAVALTRQMLWRNAAQAHPLAAHRVDSLGVFYTSHGDGREGRARVSGEAGRWSLRERLLRCRGFSRLGSSKQAVLFLKKAPKNVCTAVADRSANARRVREVRDSPPQKFFASFFQKRRPSLLPAIRFATSPVHPV